MHSHPPTSVRVNHKAHALVLSARSAQSIHFRARLNAAPLRRGTSVARTAVQNDIPISMHLQPEAWKGYVAAFLIVCSALVSAAGRSRESSLHKASGPSNSTRFFLTACAQFKDEDTILQEWLVHYIREGVQHFYLIDDGSTDTSQDILRPFITRGLVTLMVDDRRAHKPALSMVERYNLLFKPFFHSSTWMLHVDLDEFLYGRGVSIAGYLRGVAPEVGCISVPWKHFGSSGHVEQPRQGIVQSFLWRETFQKGMLGKSIFRTAAVRSIDMHWQMLKPGYGSGYPMAGGRMGSQSALSGNTQHLDGEQLLEQLAIHLNHYRVRWRKWYVSVKMTRGIADRDVSVYDEDYFERFNAHDILDNELAIRQNRSKRAPALPRDRTL